MPNGTHLRPGHRRAFKDATAASVRGLFFLNRRQRGEKATQPERKRKYAANAKNKEERDKRAYLP